MLSIIEALKESSPKSNNVPCISQCPAEYKLFDSQCYTIDFSHEFVIETKKNERCNSLTLNLRVSSRAPLCIEHSCSSMMMHVDSDRHRQAHSDLHTNM